MSMRTGAPVVPIFGYPEPGGRYRVVLRPAILPPTQEQKGEAADAAAQRLTARYMEVVEQEIRRQPPLWMWLHRRWRP
jgi:lauroyl/myristoyl acyltransferase